MQAGKMVDVAIHGGKTGHIYVHDRATGKLIRFSRSDDPAGKHVGAADQGRRAHAAGRQRRRRMVADGGQSQAALAYAANLHQPMTYHVEASPYPGGKLWLGGAFKTIPSEKQWGRLVAVESRHRQGGLEREDAAAADRRRARDRGRTRVQRRRQRLVQGLRRARPARSSGSINCGAGVNAPAVSYMVRASSTSRSPRAATPDRLQARQQRLRVPLLGGEMPVAN